MVSLLASWLLLGITSNGLSIAPDSVEYLSAAENFIRGEGISVSYTLDEPVPMTLFPPFYPLAVGTTALTLGTDVTSAARWLSAWSFGLTVFLAGCLIHAATESRLLSLLGSIVFLSAAPMLAVHSWAQSDPLFLSLALLGLLLLTKASESGSRGQLILSATAFGLAFLTRYVGIALTLTGVAAIMAPGVGTPRKSAKHSLTDVALVLVVSLLPTMIWTISNRNLAPGMADRELTLHFMPVTQVFKLLSTVAGLSMPMVSRHVTPDLPSVVRIVALLLMLLLVLSILIAILRDRKMPLFKSLFSVSPPTSARVLGIFLLCYPLVVIFSILFVDLETYFDIRIVLPIYSCIVILAVSFLSRLYASGITSTPWKTGLWILLFTFLSSQSMAGIVWTWRNGGNPRGYASPSWESSPLIAAVSRLPGDTKIGSNMPDAILFATGRPAVWIPSKISYSSGRANPSYWPELDGIRQELEHGGVIVIFDQAGRDWLAPTSDLIDTLDMHLAAEAVDGRIFKVGR